MDKRWRSFFLTVLVLPLMFSENRAQEGTISFDSGRWTLVNGQVVEHLGRRALLGTAFIKEGQFENGVIEFDLAVTGARSYPGVNFRSQPDGSWERIYVRPHRSGCTVPSLYSDVLQYVPSWNRVDSWQLYSGPGFTAPASIPLNRWFHVKIEVIGRQARVFLDNAVKPAFIIPDLKHGQRSGGIGLMGPVDGSAFFANFSFHSDNQLSLETMSRLDAEPGVIRDWQISKPFPALQIDQEKCPQAQGLEDLRWETVVADPNGLVDISRLYPRSGSPDAVFARSVITADRDRIFKLNFGYSDAVSLFLNQQLLFAGNSAYQFRDPSFLGIAGFFDTLYLPLKKGENELLLLVTEVSGGWGLMAQDGEAVFMAPGVTKSWETNRELLLPESVAYDPTSRAFYVSNLDAYNPSRAEGMQFISKLSLDGKIERRVWVGGLKNPAGLAIYGKYLFAAEATALVEIDIARAQIIKRIDIAGARMLNDIAIDPKGIIYISDTRQGVIFRFSNGQAQEWLSGPEIVRPNGLCVDGKNLYVGVMGDNSLKKISLANKEIQTIARLGRGSIDGVKPDGKGNIMVSVFEGRLYRVTLQGESTKLIDTSVVQQNIADFDYLPERKLIVYADMGSNRVCAFLSQFPGVDPGRR